jgi:hypothetical protein
MTGSFKTHIQEGMKYVHINRRVDDFFVIDGRARNGTALQNIIDPTILTHALVGNFSCMEGGNRNG